MASVMSVDSWLPPMTSTTADFDFLQGPFDVVSRRLRRPLTGSTEWFESDASSTAITYFAGAVSVDEMWFPGDGAYGMSIRLFDPGTREWSVHWVDSRVGRLQPPVTGRWDRGRCRLVGPDDHGGRPVLASYAWSDTTGDGGHWEQEFSIDHGRTWELNWVMDFNRRHEEPDHSQGERRGGDFDFLTGPWRVHHSRLREPLSGESDWYEFESVHHGRTYFNGAVSIDEMSLAEPETRAMTIRLFDPASATWRIYWVHSRDGRLQPPVEGSFADGVGRFVGADVHRGQPIVVRFEWSGISGRTATWRQDFSADGGSTWETNWIMRFTKEGEKSS